jgi:RNA polymerase sigma-70 factor (ECF subfamily)
MRKPTFSALSLLFETTDEQTMWRVKTQNDHFAFARLVERWEDPIRNLCMRMTGDPHRGEDLKQETFGRVFEKRNDYQPSGRFSTWLWRIALNVCYDEIRKVNRRREFVPESESNETSSLLDDQPTDDPVPDERMIEQEESELVRNAVLQLPEMYRTVLVLRHYEDLPFAKIAEILEIPQGTVSSRMAEALAKLARILEPELRENRGSRPGKPNNPKEIVMI